MPDGTKPLPGPMLKYQGCDCDIHIRAIVLETVKIFLTKLCLNITHEKFEPHLELSGLMKLKPLLTISFDVLGMLHFFLFPFGKRSTNSVCSSEITKEKNTLNLQSQYHACPG